MTGQNPLFALLAGMGQNGQQNPQDQSAGPSLPVPPAMGAGPSGPPPALASFLQSPTQNPSLPKLNPTTVTAPQSSVSPLAESTLLGFLNQNSQMGEIPDSTTFDKQFRQSTSPAREILADMFLGMSSSLTGEKFRDLKQRKYEEFQTDLANKMEQVKQQRLMQQAQAQQAGEIYRQMQDHQLSSDEANAKSKQGANEFNLKYGVDIQKYQDAKDQFQQKFNQTASHNAATEAQAQVPKDANYQQALNEVTSQYQQKGINPLQDPSKKPQFLVDVANRKHALDLLEASAKEKPPQQLVLVPNNDGGYDTQVIGPGSKVPANAVTVSGMNTMNTPTSQARSMSEMAKTVVEQVPALMQQIDALGNKIGPGPGRWNQLWVNKGGMNDPAFAGLDTDLDLWASAIVRTHFGGRGGQNYREELKRSFAMAQSPDDLKSRILHADKWLAGYSNMAKSTVPTGQAGMIFPDGTVRNVPLGDVDEAVSKYGAIKVK